MLTVGQLLLTVDFQVYRVTSVLQYLSGVWR